MRCLRWFGKRDTRRSAAQWFPQDSTDEVLTWRTLRVLNRFGSSGVEPVPFFMQRGSDSPHPSQSAPAACELDDLRFEYLDPSALEEALKQLGLAADVAQPGTRRLIATINTPKSRVELG